MTHHVAYLLVGVGHLISLISSTCIAYRIRLFVRKHLFRRKVIDAVERHLGECFSCHLVCILLLHCDFYA